MHRPIVAALAALLLPLAGARAQSCLGLASLASRPTNLTLGAQFTDGAKSYDARFGFGTSIAFGGVSGQIVDYDNVNGSAKGIGIDGGLSYLVGTGRNTSVCPIASLDYTKLPDLRIAGETVSSSATTGSVGIALGGVISTGSALNLIPFAALRGAYARTSVDATGDSNSDTDTYGVLSGGMSFAFTPGVLVRPLVSIPLGLKNSDPTYGVGVSFSFGKR